MTEHRTNSTQKQRISSFEPGTMFLGTILAVLSAIVCMQILGKVGVSANTSILGAIFAMLVSRIPTKAMRNFKNLERQNYIQTISSGAGFAASNCGLTAIAIVFVMGETKTILPMALGCLFGTAVSIFVVGKLYDSVFSRQKKLGLLVSQQLKFWKQEMKVDRKLSESYRGLLSERWAHILVFPWQQSVLHLSPVLYQWSLLESVL